MSVQSARAKSLARHRARNPKPITGFNMRPVDGPVMVSPGRLIRRGKSKAMKGGRSAWRNSPYYATASTVDVRMSRTKSDWLG